MSQILYLSRKEIEPLLTMAETVKFVEEAFGLYAKSKKGENPAAFSPMVAFHTKIPNSDIDYRAGAMDPIPIVEAIQGFGYGDNPSKHGIPSVYAVGILADLETGVPLSVMEAYFLSFLRTGAAAAVASKHLARANPRVIGMIGSGNLARHTLRAHLAQYSQVGEVRAWSRTSGTREKFAAEMSEELNVSVKQVAGAREAVEGVDIVYATTRSREAVVMDEWVSEGMHLNSFGSDAPGKQEFDPKIFNRAKVVVDSLDQCKIGGDIHKPLAEGTFKESDVYAEFGEIVNGWKKGREDDNEITVMDSTGLAALDVFTLYRAYKAALNKGVGIKLDI